MTGPYDTPIERVGARRRGASCVDRLVRSGRMTRAETLAGLTEAIAGHDDWGYGHGAFIRCDCGAHVGFPDDDGVHKGKRAHAAHVAAVALAWLEGQGWAQGAWQYGVLWDGAGPDGVLDMDDREMAYETMPDGVVRRTVTDWTPVEGEKA